MFRSKWHGIVSLLRSGATQPICTKTVSGLRACEPKPSINKYRWFLTHQRWLFSLWAGALSTPGSCFATTCVSHADSDRYSIASFVIIVTLPQAWAGATYTCRPVTQ